MANSRVPIKFDIYRGDTYQKSETFSEPIIKIGKVASSHLRLEDEVASRMHAMVEVTSPDEIYIIDLGSASGTYVNGQRTNKARLHSGDEITIGQTRIFVNVEGDSGFEDNEATMAVSREQIGLDFAAMAAEHADPSLPPGPAAQAPSAALPRAGEPARAAQPAPAAAAPLPAARKPMPAPKGTLHGFQAPVLPQPAAQPGGGIRQTGSFAAQSSTPSLQTGSQPNPFVAPPLGTPLGSHPPAAQPSPLASSPPAAAAPGPLPPPAFQTGSQPNPFANPFAAPAAPEPAAHQYATPEPVGFDGGPYEAGGDYHGGYQGAHGHDAGSAHAHGAYEDPEQVRYGLVASGPAPNPDEVETGDRALEVMIMWGDNEVLKVDHLKPVRSYYVGEATDSKGNPQADYLIGSELLGTARQPVVVESGGTGAIVIPQGATGEITIGNDRVTIQDLIQSGRAQPCAELPGAHQYPLPPGATGRVVFRGLTFLVRPVNAGKPVGVGQGGGINYKQQLWTLFSFALHGLFLAMMYFMPPGGSALSLDLLSEDARLAKYLMEPPETVEEETPDWLKSDSDDTSGGSGKRHKDDEGQMGKDPSPKTKNKYAIQGPADNADPHMAREAAKEEAKNAGILGVLAAAQGAWNSPTSPYGQDTALGYDPMSALGALMGDQIGENFGFGGLGLRGTGRGGGGDGEGTIGLGGVGTIGHGGGGGSGSGYGRGAGGFRGRDAKVPQIRSGNADVRGSLSKEVIRRVIQRHINEVRFCYEQELSTRPDLAGRVQIKFIISPTGTVQASNVESTTLGAARAETCIAQAVRRWTFPAPDGGGIVVVSYPFVLESAN